jgi:hypothetical protein
LCMGRHDYDPREGTAKVTIVSIEGNKATVTNDLVSSTQR